MCGCGERFWAATMEAVWDTFDQHVSAVHHPRHSTVAASPSRYPTVGRANRRRGAE